ncbi:MAG: methylated-DNA--[protein]-cysteine S-methyltransferase [Pseudomonadota bacterium]|nr:methylated-DNA--[protein]-cysteine S-methyltransferase [Pseudomonadota bacterium]MEE3295184.1 methylated-DNA--[protein]-cysteine S-methyltransferase [Pseudomonadota bacterium]
MNSQLKLVGTNFQIQVWEEIKEIPCGETRSYKQIAEAIGQPKSVRAVANACGKNPYPIIIPCHRVVKSDGSLGGYSGKGGINKKRELLRKEQIFL